jgi:hypothetical protein
MDYAEAIFPDRTRIAGTTLLPMQVGHALLLRRLGSPLAAPTALPYSVTLGQAAVAVFVFSRTQTRAAKRIESRVGQLQISWLGLKLLLRQERNVQALLNYVRRSWQGPTVFVPSDRKQNAQPGDGDALRTLVGTLTSRIGVTMQEAMELPLTQALWEVCGYWAQEGGLRFASPQEQEIMEFYKRNQHGETAT